MGIARINMREVERVMAEGTEQEKAWLSEQLAAYDQIITENPLQVFDPYEKQQAFLLARDPTKAFFGGNRAGKTEIGIVDDLIQAVDRECLPEHLRRFKFWEPPFFCRLVSPDFTATMEGVVFTKLRKLVPRFQLVGDSWEKAYDQQRRMLRFKNGSWFQFLTSEQDVDKHSGAALHRVHFDEEPPGDKGLQIYRENRMRLIDFGGQIMLTMTPLFGMSWAYDDVWMRRTEPGVFAITASVFDNPHIDPKEVEAAFLGMTDEEKRARAGGEFVHFRGLVYDLETEHIVDPPVREHVSKQDIVVGIDPGARWTGLVWIAFDNDNAAVVFDEVLLENPAAPVQDAVREIKRKNKEWSVDPDTYVIDPSARNRTLINADATEAAFAREGIFALHGQNDVQAGVLEVKRRLQAHSLFISSDCQRLVWEFGRYRMDDKADGRFAVVKEHDHELDAMRYALMSRPWFEHLNTPTKGRSRGFNPTFNPDFEPAWKPAPQGSAAPMGAFS